MNYNSQMKAFALDRALETCKLMGEPFAEDHSVAAKKVIEIADIYCDYTHDPIAEAEEAKVLADKKQAGDELERMKTAANA